MMMPETQTILATLDEFTDGHLIHPVDSLVALGYPRDFVAALEYRDGVDDLDLLRALAKAVGVDKDQVHAFGRRILARQYAAVIRQTLAKERT